MEDSQDGHRSVNCSRCGSEERLNVVIIPSGGEGCGRVLVYCHGCRCSGYGEKVDVSIPLSLMTPKLMAACYSHGLTESDPDNSTRIVFGEGPTAAEALSLIKAVRAKLLGVSAPEQM